MTNLANVILAEERVFDSCDLTIKRTKRIPTKLQGAMR